MCGDANQSTLSLAAKGVAGAIFSFTTHLKFKMQEGRPSSQMQAALDELVAAGVIQMSSLPGGSVEYRPLHDCGRYRHFVKHADFPITEPVHEKP